MSTHGEKSIIGTLVKLLLVALLLVAVLKLAMWVLGVAMGIGALLLFTVAPIVLVGWLALKFLRYVTRPRGTSYS
jgi:hypothetical protein